VCDAVKAVLLLKSLYRELVSDQAKLAELKRDVELLPRELDILLWINEFKLLPLSLKLSSVLLGVKPLINRVFLSLDSNC